MAYELIYFSGRGLAELTRLMFAETKTEYKDTRIDRDKDWPTLKPSTPFGQLPILKVGNVAISQSRAIARYVAAKHGLNGSNALEAAKIDAVGESTVDVRTEFGKANYATEGKEEKLKQFVDDFLPKYLNIWQDAIKANGGKYIVGDKISYADFSVFNVVTELEMRVNDKVLEKYPVLTEYVKAIKARPAIAAYLANRPQTAF